MASTSSRISNSQSRSLASSSSSSSSFAQRLLIGLLVCTLVLDLSSSLTEARPQDDPASVAEAIRLLQELETKHAQHARPRFGKRGYLQPASYGQDEQEDDWQDSAFSR